MKTRVTELFGITCPILLSGMSWISTPRMVAAVSNAGGLGILATGPMNTEQTRKAVREIRSMTDRPFGANATLFFPGARENAAVLLEEQVPVINFALGKGDWIVKRAHEYGGKVIATVALHEHAKRAEGFGTDALIVTGHEAAAHGEAVTSLVLVPSIVDTVKIPVVAAGGFGDGRGLAAALALGAEGIAMGTRFMASRECPVHTKIKEWLVNASESDTMLVERSINNMFRVMKTDYARKVLELEEKHIPQEELMPLISGLLTKKAYADGDINGGVIACGQVVGRIHDIPTVKEIIDGIIRDGEQIVRQLSSLTV